ncbi:MAG: shikimate dehydrogenase [Anaerolineae bacterium]|nr:shikimate dehydrogenase [Anaerolineae bacterium]MDK1117154.1 shikimate dehydrogenase [Anaerolineae bacterium]
MIRLGLIGYPLGHSLSPTIHQAAIKACNLKGDFSLFPISPNDIRSLETTLESVRKGELAGLNVTIPHKQNVIQFLDAITPTATEIGAVNTIYMKAGKLTGDNTDAAGFLTDLQNLFDSHTEKQKEKNALVLGAGGSARAVVYALLNAGWKVTIAARRSIQAKALIVKFSKVNSRILSIEYQADSLAPKLYAFTLLVNTTPVGMSPKIDKTPWPKDLAFPPRAAIYDLVYNPRMTKFVTDARAAGLSAINGLGMLIEQAALAFEIWTGCSLLREPLLAAVEEK